MARRTTAGDPGVGPPVELAPLASQSERADTMIRQTHTAQGYAGPPRQLAPPQPGRLRRLFRAAPKALGRVPGAIAASASQAQRERIQRLQEKRGRAREEHKRRLEEQRTRLEIQQLKQQTRALRRKEAEARFGAITGAIKKIGKGIKRLDEAGDPFFGSRAPQRQDRMMVGSGPRARVVDANQPTDSSPPLTEDQRSFEEVFGDGDDLDDVLFGADGPDGPRRKRNGGGFGGAF